MNARFRQPLVALCLLPLLGMGAVSCTDLPDTSQLETTTSQLTGRQMPRSVIDADVGRQNRIDNIVRAYVRKYMNDKDQPGFVEVEGFGDWEAKGQDALRKIAAGF